MTSNKVGSRRRGVAPGWLTDPRFMAIVAFVLAYAIWNFVVAPSWLRGEWDPSNKVMQYLFQCQGTPSQEAGRWEPDRMLISACAKPILIAESESHQRALVLNRADSQYVVVDPESGQIVYSIAVGDYSVRSLIGDRYLYALSISKNPETPQNHYIIDIDTDTYVPMTQVPWEIKDVSQLVREYERSQGKVIRITHTPQALLFGRTANDYTAYELTTPAPSIVNDLIDSWGVPALRGYIAMTDGTRSVGGGEDCVIGENRLLWDANPFRNQGSTFCLFRFALPVISEP